MKVSQVLSFKLQKTSKNVTDTTFKLHNITISSNLSTQYFYFYSILTYTTDLKLVSAVFKRHAFLRYFERSRLKRNLTYSCFFFPLLHKHLFSPGLPRATCLRETSCLEKITVCVNETMLVMLPLVQMNKARREVNQTNQVQTKINIVKGL